MGNYYNFFMFIFPGELSDKNILDQLLKLWQENTKLFYIERIRYIHYWEFALAYKDTFNIKKIYFPYDNKINTLLVGGDYESYGNILYSAFEAFSEKNEFKNTFQIKFSIIELRKSFGEYFFLFTAPDNKMGSLCSFNEKYLSYNSSNHLQSLNIFLDQPKITEEVKIELNRQQEKYKLLLEKINSVSLVKSDIDFYNKVKMIGIRSEFNQSIFKDVSYRERSEEFISNLSNLIHDLSTELPEITTINISHSNPYLVGTKFCEILQDHFKQKSTKKYSFEELELLDHFVNSISIILESIIQDNLKMIHKQNIELKNKHKIFQLLKLFSDIELETKNTNEIDTEAIEHIGFHLFGYSTYLLNIDDVVICSSLIKEFLNSIIKLYDFLSDNLLDLLKKNIEPLTSDVTNGAKKSTIIKILDNSDLNENMYLIYDSSYVNQSNNAAIAILTNLIKNVFENNKRSEFLYLPFMSATTNNSIVRLINFNGSEAFKGDFWRVNSSLFKYWNIPILTTILPYYMSNKLTNNSVFKLFDLKVDQFSGNNRKKLINSIIKLGLIDNDEQTDYFKLISNMLREFDT